MNQILLLFSICLIVLNVHGQDALAYYEKINEGKLYAIKKDFQSATNAYQRAFENADFSFARDCYNAIELAVRAQDTAKLGYFLSKAILRGIQLEHIEAAGILMNYANTTFYNHVKEKKDSLYNVYVSSVNWELRKEINEMFSEDQKIREEYYNAALIKRKKIGKRWEELNARQVDRLVEITKTYGFPGEQLIGIDKNDMHPKVVTNGYSAGMPIVLLIHHFSRPNTSHDELLLEEVKKGNLYNEHFATICDFEAEFGKKKYEYFGYFGLRHYPKKAAIPLLNSNREKIRLLKVEQINQLNQVECLTKFWKRLY